MLHGTVTMIPVERLHIRAKSGPDGTRLVLHRRRFFWCQSCSFLTNIRLHISFEITYESTAPDLMSEPVLLRQTGVEAQCGRFSVSRQNQGGPIGRRKAGRQAKLIALPRCADQTALSDCSWSEAELLNEPVAWRRNWIHWRFGWAQL